MSERISDIDVEAIRFASDELDSDPSSLVPPTTSMKGGGVPNGSSWGRQQLNWLFKKIYNAIDTLKSRALDKGNNLSDVASASTSRINLGLGSAATHNVGEQVGQVLRVGNSFGLGTENGAGDYATNVDNHFKSGFYKARGDAVGGTSSDDGGVLVMAGQNDTKQLGWDSPDVLRMRGNDSEQDPTQWSEWRTILHTGNTINSGYSTRPNADINTNSTGGINGVSRVADRPLFLTVTAEQISDGNWFQINVHDLAITSMTEGTRVARYKVGVWSGTGYVDATITAIIPKGMHYLVSCSNANTKTKTTALTTPLTP